MARGFGVDGRGIVSDGRGLFVGDTGATGLIDNFEDSPDGPYATGEDVSNYYDGDTSVLTRNTSSVAEGSYGLHSSDTSGAWFNIISQPGDGLPNYPEPGDWVAAIGRDASGANHNHFIVCGGTDGTGYGYRFSEGENTIGIRNWISRDDTTVIGSDTSVSINNDTWYWFEFLFPDSSGDVQFEVYEFDTNNLNKGTHLATVSDNVVNTGDDEHLGQEGFGWGEDGNQSGTFWDWGHIIDR